MITYETSESPVYEANKRYCEQIEKELENLRGECSGFCNSFGYEINSIFSHNNLIFHLKILKSQHTRNGVYIPVNARDSYKTEITVAVPDVSSKIEIGKNKWKRLLMSKELKEKVQPPYFISGRNISSRSTKSITEIIGNRISELTVKNGEMNIKIHKQSNSVTALVKSVEKILSLLSQ